jgi:hypothetical protein
MINFQKVFTKGLLYNKRIESPLKSQKKYFSEWTQELF